MASAFTRPKSLRFFLWGHLKQLVYATPVNTVEELERRVNNAALQIGQNHQLMNSIQDNWIRRANACILNGGRHFEHLL